MTDEQLSALEAAARAATPGPWFRPIANDTAIRSDDVDIAQTVGAYELGWERMEADAAYIAAANPAAVLALIERVRELEGDAARFRHIIAGAEHFPDPEPRSDAPLSWGWSIQWGCWTHQGADIRSAIDATMTKGD